MTDDGIREVTGAAGQREDLRAAIFTQRSATVMLVMEARALNRFQARKSCLLVAKLNVR